MIAQGGGRIINIGFDGRPDRELIRPCLLRLQGGVEGLTKSLARSFARHNILVKRPCPALIDTEILLLGTPEQWKETLESIPLKRLGDPNDLAEAVVFLWRPTAGISSPAPPSTSTAACTWGDRVDERGKVSHCSAGRANRLEVKEGGGCSRSSASPFSAAGIFATLVAARIVSLKNATDVRPGPGR